MTVADPSDHSRTHDNAPDSGNERVSAGQSPDAAVLQRLAALIAGSPHNLVARGEREHVLERHVAEADALAAMLSPTGRWLDLGTGGGLPGLVLAYRHPTVAWTLLDATRKKIEAVAGFATDLGLTNVSALPGRAETFGQDPAHRAHYLGVVSRAVAPMRVLAELARGFLGDGGLLVAVKGPAWEDELAQAQKALQVLRMHVLHTAPLPDAVRPTWVVTMRANGPPPTAYPRRDGVPKQDPLT